MDKTPRNRTSPQPGPSRTQRTPRRPGPEPGDQEEPNTPGSDLTPRVVLSLRSVIRNPQSGLGQTGAEGEGTGQPGTRQDLARVSGASDLSGLSSGTEVYSQSQTLSSVTEQYSLASISSTQSLDPVLPQLTGIWSQIRLYREAQLDDVEACFQWCSRVCLVSPAVQCRRHRMPRTLAVRADRQFPMWYCARCRDRVSSTAGTIFEDCRLPIGQALVLVWCYSHGSSYEEARTACVFRSGEDGPTDRTISNWYGYLRDRMIDSVELLREVGGRIGGPGVIVQIDEALIGRRKYNRGRIVAGTWVCGMIAADGQVRLEICARRDAETLHAIIRRNVLPASILHTDGWLAYNGLERHGYHHTTVNHSVEFVADDGTHTQRIESQWRAIRRKFSRGGIRHQDIGDHLVEYLWRRDCRLQGRDPFASLVSFLSYE